MKRTIFLSAALAALTLSVSGCTSLKQAIGIDKQPPDEYSVVENAPLTLPPDFGLRPPTAAAAAGTEDGTNTKAQDVVFGSGAAAAPAPAIDTSGLSAGEASLLTQAGTTKADPDVRDKLNNDGPAQQKSLVHRILFWHQGQKGEETLDPVAEQKRLQGDTASDATTPDSSK